MPRRRPNTTTPDPELAADFAACLRDDAHLSTLVGLMGQRGVELVPVRGVSANGTPWGAIVMTGAENAAQLQRVAAMIAAQLDAERRRLRTIADRG